MLAARCASAKCGKFEHSFSAHDPEIPQIAAKIRWDLAVEEQERRQGRWWTRNVVLRAERALRSDLS